MPADLKKVAREMLLALDNAEVESLMTHDGFIAIVESRLQTLVSEVRAQAMEEAASIADANARMWVSDDGNQACNEISEAIRRASGNSGKD
jgi:hypothetical protein